MTLQESLTQQKKEFWIGLQNFQGFREYTQIPLAPITLLYGQNSAGKSTIHDALEFLHSFFSGKWDDKTTRDHLSRWENNHISSSPLTQGFIGQPKDVVLSISLGDFPFIGEAFFQWELQNVINGQSDDFSPASRLFWGLWNTTTEIQIQIYIHFNSKVLDNPIRKVTLVLGDSCFMEYEADHAEGFILFNKHNLIFDNLGYFFKDETEDIIDIICKGEIKKFNDNQYIGLRSKNCFIGFGSDLKWKPPLNWVSMEEAAFGGRNIDLVENSIKLQWLIELFDSLFIIPAILVSQRTRLVSIPPLRPIPNKESAVFLKKNNQHEKELDCWSNLAFQVCTESINGYSKISTNKDWGFFNYFPTPRAQLSQVNHFLSHPDFLDTGYEVCGNCRFLVSVETFLTCSSKTNNEMHMLLENQDAEIHLKIKQISSGNLLEIEDVGVGISQIIPVLYAIINDNSYIQQPELHLHPRLQAQLADAFIECNNKSRYPHTEKNYNLIVIESHSEHFLLRMLRRIRETYKSDIKNKLFSLYPQNVSVLYIDKLADGSSKVFPLRISKDGEFIDRWPHGFFTERDGELFDE